VPFLDVLKPCREEMGGAKYNQDDKPADELSEISGHAVRAMYYYSAITDLAALEHNTGYEAAMDRVYASMQRNMYLTGGIGQSRSNEGFTQDYDLPNDSYCETCASVGVVYWASRMNRLKMRANYMDVAERAMYNGAIAGISLSGDRFFYVNPLVSDGTHHRKPWHNTSCCPTQITRFLPSVGDYLYAIKGSTIFVNLYVQSKAKIVLSEETVTLSQTTNYPWDGNITIRLEENLKTPVVLKLRIPDWCRGFVLSQNGKSLASSCVTDGYVTVSGCCKAGDTVRLELEMPIRLVTADERVVQDRSKVAVARGPLVYCMEGTDNADMADYAITDGSRFVTQHSEELGGAVTILDAVGGGVFVPYYAWDNRDAGTMQVWVTYRQDN
ncbi:MAG: glycoside hydrolase family 127 protein, partial [Angelakisella sp.]